MDRCSHCGSELSPQARFCVTCGNAVEPLPEQAGQNIPNNNNYYDETAGTPEDETVFMADPASYVDQPVSPYPPGPPLPMAPVPAMKPRNTWKWILGTVLVLVLLLGGAGFYLITISNPQKVISSFAHQLEQGDYQAAYEQLEIGDRNPSIRNLDQEKNFVNWQRMLDDKDGSIEKVEVTDVNVDDWGWGSKESYASAVLNINRPKGSQEVHIHLRSNERNWLGVVPEWNIEFPNEVVDLSGLNLLNGTEVFLDGESLMSWNEKDTDELKVETFAGDHDLTFKTPITRTLEIFPIKHLDSIDKSSFQLLDDEDQAVRNAVKNAALAETRAWESIGSNTDDLQKLTAVDSDYSQALENEIKEWISQNFQNNYTCQSIKRPLNVTNISNIKILDSIHVECTADENYSMEVKYTSNNSGMDKTWTDSNDYTVIYTLVKEGGTWKVASRRRNQ